MAFFETLGRYFLMIKGMFTKPENVKMYWKELMHQCVEIGMGSLPIVAIISVFMGAVSAAQTASVVSRQLSRCGFIRFRQTLTVRCHD